MFVLEFTFRCLHILSAIVLVGGCVYHQFVFRPTLDVISDEEREEVARSGRRRFALLVMATSGLLLVSGMIRFSLIVGWYDLSKGSFPGDIYHMLFGIKVLVAFAVFYISSRLAGSSDGANRFRHHEFAWSTTNLLLATLVVCIATLMSLADRTEKWERSTSSAQPERPAQTVSKTTQLSITGACARTATTNSG